MKKKKTKTKKSRELSRPWLVAFIILIAVIVFLGSKSVFLEPNYTKLLGYDSLGIQFFKSLTYSWNEVSNLGFSGLDFPRAMGNLGASSPPPLSLLRIILLPFNSSFGQKILFSFYLILPFLTMFILANFLAKKIFSQEEQLIKTKIFPLLASVLYAVTPYLGSFVINQRFIKWYGLGYALFPLLIYFYYQATDWQKNKNSRLLALLAGGLILGMAFHFFMHLVVILGIFIGFDIVYRLIQERKIKLLGWRIVIGLGLLLIALLLNSYVFLPLVFYSEPTISSIKTYFEGGTSFNTLFNSLENIITFRNIDLSLAYNSGQEPLTTGQYFIYLYPLLAILGLVVTFRRGGWYFLLLALLGIFIVKGVHPPLTKFSELFFNLPFMQGFRDPNKFFIVIALAYAVLGASFFSWVWLQLQKIKFSFLKISLSILLAVFFLIMVYSLNPFYFSGSGTNYYSQQGLGLSVEAKATRARYLQEIEDTLSAVDLNRLLIFPLDFPWLKTFFTYPRSDMPGWEPTYSAHLMHFLLNNLDQPFWSGLLAKTGSSHILLDKQLTATARQDGLTEVEELLEKNDSLDIVVDNDLFRLYQNKLNNNFPFYLAPGFITTFSDLNIWPWLYQLSGDNLTNIPLVFADQQNKSFFEQQLDQSSATIFFNQDSFDLVADYLIKDYVINPQFAVHQIDSQKDWVRFESAIPGFIADHGSHFISGYSFGTEAPGAEISIPFYFKEESDYILLARIFLDDKGSQLSFTLDQEPSLFFDAETKDYNSFKWQKLGKIHLNRGSHQLLIKNLNEGRGLIDGLLLVPEKVFNQASSELNNYLAEKPVSYIYTDQYRQAVAKVPTLQLNNSSSQNVKVIGTYFEYQNDFETDDWQNESTYNQEQSRKDELEKTRVQIGAQKLKPNIDNSFYFSENFEGDWQKNIYGQTNFTQFFADDIQGQVLIASEETGNFYLDYRITSNQGLAKLNLGLDSLFLASDRLAKIFISDDGQSWQQVGKSLANDQPGYNLDASSLARGRKVIFVRFMIDDQSDIFGSWLTGIRISGQIDQPAISQSWGHYQDEVNGQILATGQQLGDYYLVYEVSSDISLESLKLFWQTIFLAPDRIGQFFVSLDNKNWIKVSDDLIVDDNDSVVNASQYVKGHKKIYIKYQIKDQNIDHGSLITSLGFSGAVEPIFEPMISENLISLAKNYDGYIVYGADINQVDFSSFDVEQPEIDWQKKSPARYHLQFSLSEPAMLVFKNSYSPYWQLGKNKSVVTDYYANGYFLTAGDYDVILKHQPNTLYRGLLILSFLSYIAIIFLLVFLAKKKKK